MSGIYITEVNLKKTNDFQTPDELKRKNEIDINNGKSAFLVKNEKEFVETTSKMLNYMVEEQTDFADLMKIEEINKIDLYEFAYDDYWSKFFVGNTQPTNTTTTLGLSASCMV